MRQHTLYWASSYDRGLDILLFMWPDIIKKYPDAQLHVCYGWDLFNAANRTNPERMSWKKSVQSMMNQKGIIHHGRIGKSKLKKVRRKCGIWAYPTYFTEINCITALECQKDGVVPVTMTLAALRETVGCGVKVKGNIRDIKVQQEFLEELLSMMGDKDKWTKEQKKGKGWAKKYMWDKIAKDWGNYFKEPIDKPSVSVITITIREGWWNLMADNLSKQTYKNFEWIIVDDYPKDRSKTAKKYADKYGLNIRYVRGDKCLGKYKRKIGLVRANNIGWKKATGELTVWLQDFIIIPTNGIESLVDIYRHNPDALIAPVDIYYFAKKPNMKNKEDWWDGDTDIVDKFSWRNVRVEYLGIRKTDNPFDFEMNYSAIPKKILDKLNGWWEFFDEGLGFDNTEIAYRAQQLGYDIIIDDTNMAICIDLWPVLKGKKQNISNRERLLNIPRWLWFKKKKFNPIRDEKLDYSISHHFKVPEEISNEDCSDWIKANAKRIIKGWE